MNALKTNWEEEETPTEPKIGAMAMGRVLPSRVAGLGSARLVSMALTPRSSYGRTWNSILTREQEGTAVFPDC